MEKELIIENQKVFVSDLGVVYNSKHQIKKIQTYGTGYKYIGMTKHNYLVHRLVAKAFISDCLEDKQVHHINGNKADNRLENLKVMTMIEHQRLHNQIYSETKICEVCGKEYIPAKTKRKRSHTCSNECKIKLDFIHAGKRKRPINQYSENGDFIKNWNSARDIQNETGYFESNINKCCKGLIKKYKGYIWKYAR